MNGHRNWGGPSEEHQPVAYWRGHPIYASHFIVIVYCTLMIVMAIGGNALLAKMYAWMGFESELLFSGQVWRLFTYGLFNPPSLWFAIDMLMLVWFGRELERNFGRRIFLFLYGGIYLVPTVVLSLLGLFNPTSAFGQPGAFALFIAFATHFPGMPIFFTLLAKWAALILVGIFTLIHLAQRNWTGLVFLWSTSGFAHLFVRHQQGRFELPRIKLWRRKPKLRVLPDLPAKKAEPVRVAKENATMAEIDALLDKIATSGMSSLTPKERAKLDAARADLLKRGSRRE